MNKKKLKSDELQSCWIEAFKTGEVTDMAGNVHNFSESDLEELNEGIHNQVKGGYQPPMVKGHPNVDDPRVASIVDSRVSDKDGGKVLEVKVDDVDSNFAEEAKAGNYKYVSAAIYKSLKKGLRHLGALGAVAPAMKGMAPICFGEGNFAEIDQGESEQDVCVFAESYSWDRLVPRSVFERLVYKLSSLAGLFRSQRELLIEQKSIEEADKIYPESLIKDLESIPDTLRDDDSWPKQNPPAPPAESASNFAAENPNGEPAVEGTDNGATAGEPSGNETTGHERSGGGDPKPTTPSPSEPTSSGVGEGNSDETERLRDENASLKAEVESLRADKLAAKRTAASAAFSETLDAAIADGRCNQDLKNTFMKVFGMVQSVPVDGDGCFGEGEERVNPVDVLSNAVKALPKIVALGESAMFAEKPTVTASQRISQYMAEQEAKGRKLTYAQAASEIFH